MREGTPARLTYALTLDQSVVMRLPQATDGRPLRVLVSPNVARSAPADGAITLDFQDVRLPAQIVGVADRFPDSNDLGQGFVVVDESHLATALGSDAPGTSTPDELWLSGPAAARRTLSRSPFTALQLASRRDLQQHLADRPLARGITWTLGAAGLIALLLAGRRVGDARERCPRRAGSSSTSRPRGAAGDAAHGAAAALVVLVGFGMVGGVALGLACSRGSSCRS